MHVHMENENKILISWQSLPPVYLFWASTREDFTLHFTKGLSINPLAQRSIERMNGKGKCDWAEKGPMFDRLSNNKAKLCHSIWTGSARFCHFHRFDIAFVRFLLFLFSSQNVKRLDKQATNVQNRTLCSVAVRHKSFIYKSITLVGCIHSFVFFSLYSLTLCGIQRIHCIHIFCSVEQITIHVHRTQSRYPAQARMLPPPPTYIQEY